MFYAATILAIYLLVNGLMMVSFSSQWYQLVPGVSASGPFNGHFVVDIGFTFILSALAIFWRLIDGVKGRGAAIFCAGFLFLHASFHLYDVVTSNHHDDFFLTDIFGIYLPAITAIAVVSISAIELPMWFQAIFRRAAHWQIANFEKRWDYDGTYMHEIADADLEAITRFSLLEDFGAYRQAIPKEGWYTAKLLGSLSEDCGPCVQLVVRMAEAEGMVSDEIAAILDGRIHELRSNNASKEIPLFYDYARAVLNHDLEAENLRAKIENRFGKRAVTAAGMALISGKAFPLMKYATGHGQHCMQVTVNGVTRSVDRTMIKSQSFAQ